MTAEEFDALPIETRLRAPAYWMSGSGHGHEGENNLPFKAADEIETLRNLLNAKITRVDVDAARARADAAESKLARALALLEECAVWMFTREKIGAGSRICDRAADLLAAIEAEKTTP